MSAVHHMGRASALPLSLIAQAIPKLSRCDLAALAERLIDRLDEVEGDIDREEDDPAGQCDEDGINTVLHLQWAAGAGCSISDEDCDMSDYEHGMVCAETFRVA